ncbi:MAG TPA: RNA polymerase factor sigma-54 [Kiloniellaceae bacterium]|nr:RNA polymerase factor sigma-54 [Kiloniellaceae bacterium]
MAISQGLELRQNQTLVMTPQLQQAIRLLQYSTAELAAYLEGELAQNPLLELAETSDADIPVAENAAADDDGRRDADATGSDAEVDIGDESQGFRALAEGDIPPDTLRDGEERPAEPSHGDVAGSRSGGDGGWDGNLLEETLSQGITLRQHLLNQVQLTFRDPMRRLIAINLTDQVDDAGYWLGDPRQVAQTLGCPVADVEATLKKLQQFDPVGVFAGSLKECLALQLADRDRLDPAMAVLLDNLPLLAKGALAELRRLCGVDGEDLADMIREIRALNPKPAEGFDCAPAQLVVPDILLQRGPNGDWVIELNSETLPRVLVNEDYIARVRATVRRQSDRDYLSERRQAATWLVRALDQRATTILKVAREIVRQQERFFRLGIQYLQPLTLKDVAAAIEMHESTVSRATANKFMATPRGTYELRFFFTAGLAGDDGERRAAESIRHRIKAIIDEEAADAVLSDESIVKALRVEGVQIARRTVAKYREAMQIPSSAERRRTKVLSI